MRSERKKQIMTLSLLLVGIIVISIGFAAFSSKVRINPSMIVSPDENEFKVVFSSNPTALETNAVKPNPTNMGEDATIDNTIVPTISGISTNFEKPGDSVIYTFYVYNAGEYEAFLNSITLREKLCIQEDGTDYELANHICDSITMTLSVGNITTTESLTDITGESLKPGESKPVTITITYDANAELSDGQFIVEFGDISFYYATISGITEEVEKICKLTYDRNYNEEVDLTDEITCGTETFYVIPNDTDAHPTATDNNLTLLAKYNLDVGADAPGETPGIQNAKAIGFWSSQDYEYQCNFNSEILQMYKDYNLGGLIGFYHNGYGCDGTIPFSETQYWDNTENSFVYNNQSLLYPYVENYRKYIESFGVDVKEASLMSYNQLKELSGSQMPNYFNRTVFWLGSSSGSSDNIHIIDAMAYISYGIVSQNAYETGYKAGVRPIIVISKKNVGIVRDN